MPVAQRRSSSRTAEAQKNRSGSTSVSTMPSSDGSSRQRPRTVEDLFGGGTTGHLLKGEHNTAQVYDILQRRHRSAAKGLIDPDTGVASVETDDGRVHHWKVPYGVRAALKAPLIHAQIVNKYPWYVTWMSPKTGKRMRKYFSSLPTAIVFVTTRAQYVDSHASIVSRHGYDIPAPLRNKIPSPYKWCPCCMTARKFYRTDDTFFGRIKQLDPQKGYYVWKERKLALMRCKVCSITNRDFKFRRSNQHWELRKFKKGVTRAKRRR